MHKQRNAPQLTPARRGMQGGGRKCWDWLGFPDGKCTVRLRYSYEYGTVGLVYALLQYEYGTRISRRNIP